MKRLLMITALLVSCQMTEGYGGKRIRGYYKKNGTYVKPHYRSRPNKRQRDNYSFDGNINPYTGKKGRKKYKRKNNKYGF